MASSDTRIVPVDMWDNETEELAKVSIIQRHPPEYHISTRERAYLARVKPLPVGQCMPRHFSKRFKAKYGKLDKGYDNWAARMDHVSPRWIRRLKYKNGFIGHILTPTTFVLFAQQQQAPHKKDWVSRKDIEALWIQELFESFNKIGAEQIEDLAKSGAYLGGRFELITPFYVKMKLRSEFIQKVAEVCLHFHIEA